MNAPTTLLTEEDRQREQRIDELRKEVERCQLGGFTTRASEVFAQMAAEIAQRSPAQIAHMEAQQGLA